MTETASVKITEQVSELFRSKFYGRIDRYILPILNITSVDTVFPEVFGIGEVFSLSKEETLNLFFTHPLVSVRPLETPKEMEQIRKNKGRFIRWPLENSRHFKTYSPLYVVTFGHEDNKSIILAASGSAKILTSPSEKMILHFDSIIYDGNTLIFETYPMNESPQSRIRSHTQKNGSFGVMSALVGKDDRWGNHMRHRELKATLRQKKIGFAEMKACFRHEGRWVEELSFFIADIKQAVLLDLGVKYEQFSVLYKDKNEFVELSTNQNSGTGTVLNRFQTEQANNSISVHVALNTFHNSLLQRLHEDTEIVVTLSEILVPPFTRRAFGNQ